MSVQRPFCGLRDRLDLVAADEERHATDLPAAHAGRDRRGARAGPRALERGGAARRTAGRLDTGHGLRRSGLRRGRRGRGRRRLRRRRRGRGRLARVRDRAGDRVTVADRDVQRRPCPWRPRCPQRPCRTSSCCSRRGSRRPRRRCACRSARSRAGAAVADLRRDVVAVDLEVELAAVGRREQQLLDDDRAGLARVGDRAGDRVTVADGRDAQLVEPSTDGSRRRPCRTWTSA